MKTQYGILWFISIILLVSCGKDFLSKQPQGEVDLSTLENEAGINALLVGAYALLDGNGTMGAYPANLIWGSLRGDELHKGCDPGCGVEMAELERQEPQSANIYLLEKWEGLYHAIGRCNDALSLIKIVEEIDDETRNELTAEARFLRGHYHFEAKRLWNNVPYVGEDLENHNVPNDRDIWPDILADFEYAAEYLPQTQSQPGRATKGAAEAYLAKSYMYLKDYERAKPLLETVITARGYSLAPLYWQNFNAAFKNNSEAIFQVQMSVNDGANGANGNRGNWGTGVYNAGPDAPNSLGYFQPSQDLVNAFRTENGLPLLNEYYLEGVKSDLGLSSSQPFEPHTGSLDPRLDWAVARRGIPYLGWGNFPGQNWIRDQSHGGPYMTKKYTYTKDQNGEYSEGANSRDNAVNINVIRLADVVLMAAECEVEIGTLEQARTYVNMIRERAANSEGFVKMDDGSNAANYEISLYETPWTDQEMARNAVYFERRLELALEGHRAFDLVRWDIADQTINRYIERESSITGYLSGGSFSTGINEYMPIPLNEIFLSSEDGVETLKQNPGYR
ncbi:RagB/SusD family nutrient uptake outer membrane protein [Olivibacter sp. SDN3]|uniref:RagB/SusD family nutrient uptake outer membrane protein n=1 Tax=Olivibacter sp. SDN3 TaxID=2764720 RepID=UPI0016514D37|nr:RagB/SusD family nutrient uptake outer membrane protein [Olivibacter sp. SDN3]QNL49220.1 RagB/SusD family nutrient uptake outer membrane protein [Olivibacter sp. SDN3]